MATVISVGATGDYATLSEAIAYLGGLSSLPDDYDIVLLEDVSIGWAEMGAYIVFDGRTIRILGNGHTITGVVYQEGILIRISDEGGVLQIRDLIYSAPPEAYFAINLEGAFGNGSCIENCNISGSPYGIHIYKVTSNNAKMYMRIAGCRVSNTTWSGIKLWMGGTLGTYYNRRYIENCVVYNCASSAEAGVYLGADYTRATLRNVAVLGCPVNYGGSSSLLTWRGANTFENCASSDDTLSGALSITEADFASVDPTSRDFLKITKSSKMYGVGVTSITPTTDPDGNARPNSAGKVSIGYYEPPTTERIVSDTTAKSDFEPSNYILEILDNTGTRVAILTGDECSVQINRKINAEWGISIQYPIPPEGQGEDKSSYLDAWKARARIVNLDDTTDYQTFILATPSFEHRTDGSVVLTVVGEHIAIERLRSEIIEADYDFQNAPIASVITKILGHSSVYAPGSVTSTGTVTALVGWETVLSALQRVVAASGSEWDVDEANVQIDVAAALGSATKTIFIRPERNLRSVRRTKYVRDVINKYFGLGGGMPTVTLAGARHRVYSIVGQVVTVDHAKLVPENDSWNTYKVKFATGALAGLFFTVADSAHSTRDTLTLVGDISTAVAGDMIIMCNGSNEEIPYIRASGSITTYGQTEGVYRNARYGDVANLVKTPYLDGAYTGGQCANWSAWGSDRVLTENTNASYITYGTKSQKIVTSTEGGIYQVVEMDAGAFYEVSAWVYLVSGSVNIWISTGSEDQVPSGIVTDAGWHRLSIKVQKKMDGETTVAVRCIGTVYVDVVQVAETTLVDNQLLDKPFTDNCERTDLWFEVFDRLCDTKDPVFEYKASFGDLYRMNRHLFPDDKIEIGDTVYITDEQVGIVNLSARVMEISWRPFSPELSEHTISTEV